MSLSFYTLLESKLLSVAVSTTRPTVGGDGVDITGWRLGGGYAPRYACVFIDGDAALTVASPTGGTAGPELWGWRLSQWWLLGVLNGGTTITVVGTGQGYVEEVEGISLFERIAVAGTKTGGNATAILVPIESAD